MKVIAQITKDKFLAEISRDEVGNLRGESSGYSISIEVGMQISVDQLYQQFSALLRHRGELKKTAKELRELADLLLAKDPIVSGALG